MMITAYDPVAAILVILISLFISRGIFDFSLEATFFGTTLGLFCYILAKAV